MLSEVVILVIQFMFLGINIFWVLLRAHFNPRLTARAKISLSIYNILLFQKTLSKEKQKAHKPRLQGNMEIFETS